MLLAVNVGNTRIKLALYRGRALLANWVIATVSPRSLKDPVGFKPSYLKKSRRRPSEAAMFRLSTSGVEPSSRSTIGVASVTGRRSR